MEHVNDTGSEHVGDLETDERYMGDWVAYGIGQAELMLANHAAYERWCAKVGRQP